MGSDVDTAAVITVLPAAVIVKSSGRSSEGREGREGNAMTKSAITLVQPAFARTAAAHNAGAADGATSPLPGPTS